MELTKIADELVEEIKTNSAIPIAVTLLMDETKDAQKPPLKSNPLKNIAVASSVKANIKSFKDLNLCNWLINQLDHLSLKQPTPVQTACIPEILNGKDVIASAVTGSGKTLAFALPILSKLSKDPFGFEKYGSNHSVYALVLTPTRELAFQIAGLSLETKSAEQFKILGHEINLKVSVVTGGMDMLQQALDLTKKPHIVIATPGRLLDHIKSSLGAIHFKRIKTLVLDEADRLLTPTFAKDLKVIFSTLPVQRQTLLFSATMTVDMKELNFKRNLISPTESAETVAVKKPFVFEVTEKYEMVEKVILNLTYNRYLFIPSAVREPYLYHLLSLPLDTKTVIIFCARPKTCELLRLMLSELLIRSTCLHSQMSQSERIGSLAKFKGGIVKILICTDVASRGLDIPAVNVVLNFELPADPAEYIHRVGRTARAGRDGMSLSFVTERDIDIVHGIEAKTGTKMVDYEVSENAVLELLSKVNVARRAAAALMDEREFGERGRIQREKMRILKGDKKQTGEDFKRKRRKNVEKQVQTKIS